MTLPAIQTNLFHNRKQHVSESVDAYAQELRTLFHKAYPSVQQGTRETEALGQTILTNQFVVGLLPDIKTKIVGSEGDFNQLLFKARFEEVKLCELGVIQSPPPISVTQDTPNIPRSTFISRQQRSSGARPNVSPRCYNCGSTFHLIRQCPHLVKNKNTDTPGKKGNESRDSNHVSNITLAKESPRSNYNEDGESRDDISSELDEIIATMHGITPDNVTGRVQLGPTLTAMIEVEGEVIEALLDTGSPVTIIQLETFLQILAKNDVLVKHLQSGEQLLNLVWSLLQWFYRIIVEISSE